MLALRVSVFTQKWYLPEVCSIYFWENTHFMKKSFFALILLLGMHVSLRAQNCAGYYYMQNNKTIEMEFTNKKGKVTNKNIYTVSDVKQAGGFTTSTVNSTMLDGKGKTIAQATNKIKCSGGAIMLDMKMFIPAGQQEQMGTSSTANSEAYLEYPADMKVGDALKDGSFSMDFKSGSGINGHLSVDLTNRKVEGKESVTTAAGTWDCFKITYHSKISMKIMVNIPINMDMTEWYAPGFGVVKSSSDKGTGTAIVSVH